MKNFLRHCEMGRRERRLAESPLFLLPLDPPHFLCVRCDRAFILSVPPPSPSPPPPKRAFPTVPHLVPRSRSNGGGCGLLTFASSFSPPEQKSNIPLLPSSTLSRFCTHTHTHTHTNFRPPRPREKAAEEVEKDLSYEEWREGERRRERERNVPPSSPASEIHRPLSPC